MNWKKRYTIDGLGTVYQPLYAIYGDERRALKKELGSLRYMLKMSPHWESVNRDMYAIYGGEPKRIKSEEQWEQETKEEIRVLEARLQEPFTDEKEWVKIKWEFLASKYRRINRLIEQGKEIPESLSKNFVTFPLTDNPYDDIE
jgi:hypothetical protein